MEESNCSEKEIEESKPLEEPALSKKAAKKQEKKLRRRIGQQQPGADSSMTKQAEAAEEEDAISAADYGDERQPMLKSKTGLSHWTEIEALTKKLKGQRVILRGEVHKARHVGKNLAFLELTQDGGYSTVQCVVTSQSQVELQRRRQGELKNVGWLARVRNILAKFLIYFRWGLASSPPLPMVSRQMVKYVSELNKHSAIDIEGIVSVPAEPIKGTTQQVEVHVQKLYCVARAEPPPFCLEDAARSEQEIEKALQAGTKLVRVNQDTRLNHRAVDLQTPANNAIFKIQYEIEDIFWQWMKCEGFIGIRTPVLNAGSSEGGACVFKLDYFGQPASLAQSPQLHKQMAICGRFRRVFTMSQVFRAEHSSTHRHLCEFAGLDVEMEIEDHYFEVIDTVERLFITIFENLNKNCKKELKAVGRQYPFSPLKYLPKTLRLTFEEGVQMLKDAGVEIDPMGDLTTEAERKLGQLVLEKYGTEFYILHGFPLAVRPFYTMPSPGRPAYSNSFDVFVRGEEIISGGERINEAKFLTERAVACGIDVKPISWYIDSFRHGVRPHGGFGIGLNRLVMLFLGLDNIRKASLFPRDRHRLAP